MSIHAGSTVVCIKQDEYNHLVLGAEYIVHGITKCNCNARNIYFDVGVPLGYQYNFCYCEYCSCRLDSEMYYIEAHFFALPISDEMFSETEELSETKQLLI